MLRCLFLGLALLSTPLLAQQQTSIPAPSLATTPTLCTVTGQVPVGVDASGNAQGCAFLQAKYVTGAATYLENDVTFSATPTFSPTATVNYLQLIGNVTSSTLSTAGATAGSMTYLIMCQDSVGAHTFAWPSTVKNTFGISLVATKCSATTLVYVQALGAWVNVGPGLVGF